ncbi:hypothetical protein IV38_GL002062 [Lactobacillus selangorensis]|uniref:Phosphatidylglycerol lysyltransferase n=1 Tax=Lactobacillus selangorensis TaxID=81857 RepID=A0A0R2FSM4_9LACO|nr:bifunctional lysylphosphatidylglycerol flippase/synthetase MprF [Lactobacillus selangorensis]KRN27410.1 hypothetical protein IV38_GL002062 [Lactobacillus selangorensis]KRN31393.1 hypothetical protein IV40_GL001388 [Lactobacillus selangorensis]
MKAWLKKVSNLIEKHLTALKAIFILSVLAFVIYEVGRIAQQFNVQQLKAQLSTQSPWSLLLLFVLGFVAVLPMLNYDFVITELLPANYSKRYIAKSGWIVNTFTNLAGFGGFLGASLRANFYGKHASQKQVLLAVSKIALFLLAGLSVWCWVALAEVFIFGIGHVFANYWIWMVGGAVYFPGLMLLTHWKESKLFQDLPLKRELRLALGSALEWGACAAFFLLIGWVLKIHVDYAAVFPLFMIANVVGVVSMVPGGLGTFDVFMIFGLGALGIDSSVAVAWLLFYRLFYYIFPFLLGVVFFAQDAGHHFNAYLQGLPKQLLQRAAHGILVFFLYFTTVMLLLVATVPSLTNHSSLFQQLYPYTFFFLNRMTNIIVAFMLIGFARGIANKVRRAYWPTMIMLMVAIVYTIFQAFSVKMLVLLIFILILTFFSKSELYRVKLESSWGNRLIDGTVYALAFIFYAVAGFYNSPHIHHRHAIPTAFLFPNEKVWLSGLVGMLIAAVLLWLIFLYLHAGQQTLATPFDPDRIHAVIKQYGGNEVSHLAYLRDKEIYFYQVDGQDRVFIMYRKTADKLIVMGEPVGDQTQIMPAILQFVTDADKLDCTPVFYEISEALTMQLHEYGFDFMKFGEEGYVHLPDFNISGNKHKGERSLMNKFKREGYTFSMLQPPYSDADFKQLQDVSTEWLHGRAEKGFSLGFFDRYYLERAPIAVIRNQDNNIVAFANMMPTGDHTVTSIDLMRHSSKAPSGIMDEIFINLFYESRDEGYQYFNMGMAPLSNVGTSQFSFLPEKIAHLIYQYGARFYGFQGLRSYKNKYVSKWVSRYIAYRKHHSIIIMMIQLLLVDNRKVTTTEPKTMTSHFKHSIQLGKKAKE